MVREIRQSFENRELHYLLDKAGVAELGLGKENKGVKGAEIGINVNGWLELELHRFKTDRR